MQDSRWNDATNPPLSNGPFAATTPPVEPRFRLDADGQLVEFLIPFPIHLVDEQPWEPLRCKLGNQIVSIQKPLSIVQGYAPAGRIGNEVSGALCSIIRVHCAPEATQGNYPRPGELWPIVEQLLTWMRVKARHYWLLHGHGGFDTSYRGSVMTQSGSQRGQRNFASYGRTLIVRPLEQDLWLTFAEEINSNAQPPVAESIFCDALMSAVAGDEAKAVLELGVAAEIEITQLLADVSRTPPETHQKIKFAVRGERDCFYDKLAVWPEKLGLQKAQTFDPFGNFQEWLDLLRELYKFRGGVAHSGRLASSTGESATNYLMAANVLFAYCREQRRRAGVSVYSYPGTRSPFQQIVLFREGEIFAETSTATSDLA